MKMPKRKIDQSRPNFKRKAEYKPTTFKIMKPLPCFESALCEGIPKHELENALEFYQKCLKHFSNTNK